MGAGEKTSKILDVFKCGGRLGARMEGLVVDSKDECASGGDILDNKLKLWVSKTYKYLIYMQSAVAVASVVSFLILFLPPHL